MVRLFYLIFSFLAAIVFHGCSNNDDVLTESAGTMIYHIKNGNEIVNRTTTTRSGDVIMVGYSGSDAFIFCMGKDGREKWYETISESGTDVFSDVCETRDGGIVVCGYTNSYSFGVTTVFLQGLVMKFDPNGKEIWRRTYGLDRDDWLSTVLEVEDGNLFLGGAHRTDNMDTWLLKLDENGDMIWTSHYAIGPYFDICLDTEIKPDGNYAIVGYYSPNGFATQIRNYKVYFGNVQKDSGTITSGWLYSYERANNVNDPFRNYLTLHKTTDGYYWTDNSETSTNKATVLWAHTDFLGVVKSFKYIPSEKHNWIVDFKPDENGITLFGSEISDPEELTSSTGLLIRLDKAGEVVSKIHSGNENGQRVFCGGYFENNQWNLGGFTWNDQIGRSKLFFEKVSITD